jgi:hypothetical protein
MSVTTLSPRRGRLASFENAYAVAVQLRESTGTDQYVIGTGDPLQPFFASAGASPHCQGAFTRWSREVRSVQPMMSAAFGPSSASSCAQYVCGTPASRSMIDARPRA